MNVCILFSGGIDSACMLEMALNKRHFVHCLHFVYEHPASIPEYNATKFITKQCNVPLYVEKLPIQAKQMQIGVGKSGPRVVPNRNAIFIMHAIRHCIDYGLNQIWIGANANDQKDYYDCTPMFIQSIQRIADVYNIDIVAPLINVPKHQIKTKYQHFTHSCYEPINNNGTWIQCGMCNSCSEATK